MARLTPIGANVVIAPDEADTKSKGGIIIPDVAKEKPSKGRIIAVGPGSLGDDGILVPLEIKEGNHVLYERYGSKEVDFEARKYVIVNASNILAVIS